MRERHQLFFGLRLTGKKIPSFRNPNQNRAALWQIFSVRQPIGRQDSMQTVNRTSRRLDSFFMKRLRTLNSYQIFKIKNKKLKTYSGSCPFKELSNDTSLMQIQSGRTVLLGMLCSMGGY
jgi:hypothetical protein